MLQLLPFYQLAASFVCSQLVLCDYFVFSASVCIYVRTYVSLCVSTYHMRNNYVTYIVAMQPLFDFGNLGDCFV